MTLASGYTALAEALRDFNTYQELNQLYINMMWDAQEFHHPNMPVINHNVYTKGITISANLKYNVDYDTLIASTKGTLSINGADTIRLSFSYSHTLSNGLVLPCEDFVIAEIPNEDMSASFKS